MWITAWEDILQGVCERKGSAAYTVKCERLMVICWGMAVKRMGALGVSMRKVKVVPVKMETQTLIGKERQSLTFFVY